ncbi:MAG: CAP domain-containing protein [Mariprofundaceae bacterium]|nr:CAP domain-containing protein [Mariprofundaceae bacterium]
MSIPVMINRLLWVAMLSLVACANNQVDDLLSVSTQTTNTVDAVAPSQPTSLSPEMEQVLREHARLRAKVGVEPLQWSKPLAAYAQAWADQLARKGCAFKHRPRSGAWAQQHGENIFSGTQGYYTPESGVKSWADEKSLYNHGPFGQITQGGVVGHYTQIVWENSKRLGCGVSQCGGNMIMVCNYEPAGNVIGRMPY